MVVAGRAGEQLELVGEAGGFCVGGGGGGGGVRGGGGGVLGGGARGGRVAVVVGEDDGEVVVIGVARVGVVEGGEDEVCGDQAARAVVQRGLDLRVLGYAQVLAGDGAGWAVGARGARGGRGGGAGGEVLEAHLRDVGEIVALADGADLVVGRRERPGEIAHAVS